MGDDSPRPEQGQDSTALIRLSDLSPGPWVSAEMDHHGYVSDADGRELARVRLRDAPAVAATWELFRVLSKILDAGMQWEQEEAIEEARAVLHDYRLDPEDGR